MRHPLSPALPFAGRWLDMPAQPLPGDAQMPRVQGEAFGASQRLVVSPGHEAQGSLQMPGGPVDHPLSPFYGAGHDDWAHGKPTPLLPGAAKHTLHAASSCYAVGRASARPSHLPESRCPHAFTAPTATSPPKT